MSVSAVAFAFAVAAAPGPSVGPEQVVRRLYSDVLIEEAILRGYFARDMAAAMAREAAASEAAGELTGDEVLTYDLRYSSQEDPQVTHFRVSARPRGRGFTTVTASFRDYGQPRRIRYEMCRRADGAWRVADVIREDGSERDAGLRAAFRLRPLAQTAC